VSDWNTFFFFVRKGYLPVDQTARNIVIDKFLIPWLQDRNFRVENPRETFGSEFAIDKLAFIANPKVSPASPGEPAPDPSTRPEVGQEPCSGSSRAKPRDEGPALFVDPVTGEVRELTADEHKALHTALRTAIKDFDMAPSQGFNEDGVCRLMEDRVNNLCGQAYIGSKEARGPPVSVYIIDDAAFENFLPDEFKNIVKGLITHAGTYRTDPSGQKHANLFIPGSVYKHLVTFSEDSPELIFWREHEVIGHLADRTAPVDARLTTAEKTLAGEIRKVSKDTFSNIDRPKGSGTTAQILEWSNPEWMDNVIGFNDQVFGDKIDDFREHFTGRRVLDVGTGLGYTAIWAKENGASEVMAVDLDAYSIEAAQRIASGLMLDISFHIDDYTALGLKDGEFDVVTASRTLDFLDAHSRRKGLKELFRVTKPGGDLFIISYHDARYARMGPNDPPEREDERLFSWQKREYWLDENWQTELENAGFTGVDWSWVWQDGDYSMLSEVTFIHAKKPEAAEGPALFVDPGTGEVRELMKDEHEALHEALRAMIKDFSPAQQTDRSYSYYNEDGVMVLLEREIEKLCGQDHIGSGTTRGPPITAYGIDDLALEEALPQGFKHIAKGLIAHAGTYRTDPAGKKHANLFISRSACDYLYRLREDSPELAFWRRREVSHLAERDEPIDSELTDADKAAAKKIYMSMQGMLERPAVPVREGLEGLKGMIRQKMKEKDGRPVLVMIDGPAGVGKTQLTAQVFPTGDDIRVIHTDKFPKEYGQNWIDFAAIAREVKKLSTAGENKLIILEGHCSYEAERYEDAEFDIRIYLEADYATRRQNIEERGRKGGGIHNVKPAEEGYYDLVIDNSLQYRLPLDEKIDLLGPAWDENVAAEREAARFEKFVAEQVPHEADREIVRKFLADGEVVVAASDGARFMFSIENVKEDDRPTAYYNIEVHEMAGNRPMPGLDAGYMIFYYDGKNVICSTDPFRRSDADAISVNEYYRANYQGFGSVMMQLAGYHASFKSAEIFSVHDTSDSGYLERLGFDSGMFVVDQRLNPFIDAGVPPIEILAKEEPVDPAKTLAMNNMKYLDRSEAVFGEILGEGKPDVLLRVPVQSARELGWWGVRNFLHELQKASNAYVELFNPRSITGVSDEAYRNLGLQKKKLPETLIGENRTRHNTVTLFRAGKNEEIDISQIKMRLGDIKLGPSDTILSPIGIEGDSAGLIRSTVFGLEMMKIARKMSAIWRVVTTVPGEEGCPVNIETLKDKDPLKYRELMDDVQMALEACRNVSDPAIPFEFSDDEVESVLGLAAGDINRIVDAINKLLKFLPIKPISGEAIRAIYERAAEVIRAA